MPRPDETRRILWNSPPVVASCAIALGVTLAIILWQMRLRTGILEPESVPVFYRLFLFEDYGASFLFVAVLLLALVPSLQSAGAAVSRALGRRPLVVAVISAAVLAIASRAIYHGHPLAMDESAPVMQSMVFAAGHLLGKYPAHLIDWLIYPPFQNYFIYVSRDSGLFASAYWPGFALLLTPFSAAGVSWLCNPILGGVSLWVIHRLTRELTGSAGAAGGAVLFTIASAAFVINAVSFYSFTAHLLCNAVFALLLLKPDPVRALMAALVGGLALTLHNPVPHMLFAFPWLAWLIMNPDRLRLMAATAAGYVPWIVVVGFGWHHVLRELSDTVAGVSGDSGGAVAAALTIIGRTFNAPGVEQLFDRSIGLAKLWLWAAPVLLLMAGIGFWQHYKDARYRILLASAALTLFGFLFVPLSGGHGWGFRYFHSAWFVLPVMAGAGLARAGSATDSRFSSSLEGIAGYAQGAAIGGLFILVPYFALQVESFISAHLAQAPSAGHGHPRVVIVDPMQYYAQDLVQNDPFLRDETIRMVSHGRAADAEMMARYFPELSLLERNYRGSVWGYADPEQLTSTATAGDLAESQSK